MKRISLYTGITLLFANLVSCSSAKTLSPLYEAPTITYDEVKPKIRLNISPGKNKERIDSIVRAIENVPDGIQLFCNRAGGIVEVFDRPMEEHPLLNPPERDSERDSRCHGFYFKKTAVVPYDIAEIVGFNELYFSSEFIALHEYGHMVDILMGRPSHSKRFAAALRDYIFTTKRNFISRFILRKTTVDLSDAQERFADAFALYYDSTDSRNRMQRFHRDYFVDLERELLQRGN